MKIINSLLSLISFSIILLFENFLNLIISNTYISIVPFYILLFIFSLKRFNNRNIFPIMGSGILYDIFLSENYLGVYAIVFLLTAVSINYIYEKVIDFNFKLPFIFAFNYLIYNIPNILNPNLFSIIALSVFINYLLFILLKRVMRFRV